MPLLTAALAMVAINQVPQVFEGRVYKDVKVPYLLYLPEGYEAEPNKKWPLVMFMHGAGERGSDLNLVKVHGPTKEIEGGRKFPFILVAPQCPTGQWWDTPSLVGLLDSVEKKLRVDRNREYVTGISMGGFATWALLESQPKRFAAAAPICGGGNPLAAESFKKVPIWVTHGDKDQAVNITESQKMVDALNKVGGDVRFTIVKDGGHDVWSAVYKGTEVYDWLLSKKRK